MGWPGPLTHRQWLTWQHWLAEEWTQPSLTDHYLMQLTAAVTRLPYYIPFSITGDPNSVRDSQFRLKFKTGAEQEAQVDPELAMQWSKAAWAMRAGVPLEKMLPVGDPTELRSELNDPIIAGDAEEGGVTDGDRT